MRCTPEQIILTAGSQGALDLAVRTLLNPGEAAWIENPGYFGAHGALLAAGVRLEPLPRGGLLFGYAGASEESMLLGVKRLATALRGL